MRIYPSADGKQLLADFRQDVPGGGPRDVALGTLDYGKAAARVAERLMELRQAAPLPGSAAIPQLGLQIAPSRIGLAGELSYFVERAKHAKEATKEMHRLNAKYILAGLGDVDVNAADWYDLWSGQRDKWQEPSDCKACDGKGKVFGRAARGARCRACDGSGNAAGLTNTSVNKRHATISRALRISWKRGRMLRHPPLPDYLPNDTVPRDRWQPPEEIAAFAARILCYVGVDARGRSKYSPTLRYGRMMRYLMRSWMGLRNGDARRMQVRDVSLIRREWLRRSSKKSQPERWLPLYDPNTGADLPLLIVLREWLTVRRDLVHDDPLFYPWPDEWRGLNIIAGSLRAEPLTPHDFRRTSAHLIRLLGYDRDFCRLWLGLSKNSKMLEQVYMQEDPIAAPDPGRVAAVQARMLAATVAWRRQAPGVVDPGPSYSELDPGAAEPAPVYPSRPELAARGENYVDVEVSEVGSVEARTSNEPPKPTKGSAPWELSGLLEMSLARAGQVSKKKAEVSGTGVSGEGGESCPGTESNCLHMDFQSVPPQRKSLGKPPGNTPQPPTNLQNPRGK